MSGPDRSTSPLSAAEIRRVCGEILDWKIAAISASGASLADLEAAAAWLEGRDDAMGEARRPLTGDAALIYDLLIRSEETLEED
jgi:hypothetical protein